MNVTRIADEPALPLHEPGVQPLNLMDQVMACLHASLRRRGGTGLLLQSHVHLAGRIDEAALRTAVERFGRVYPVATGRLVGATFRRRPCWEWSDGAACPLTVSDLDEDATAVPHFAEQLFATPTHLNASPLVHFHLLRKPGGRDVVVVQWSHVLMDGKGGEFLLREVNRLHADPQAVAPSLPPGDPLRQHMRRPFLAPAASGHFPDRVRPAAARLAGPDRRPAASAFPNDANCPSLPRRSALMRVASNASRACAVSPA